MATPTGMTRFCPQAPPHTVMSSDMNELSPGQVHTDLMPSFHDDPVDERSSPAAPLSTLPSTTDETGDFNEVRQVERYALDLLSDALNHAVGIPVSVADRVGGGDYERCRAAMLRVVVELFERHGDTFTDATSRLLADTDVRLFIDVDGLVDVDQRQEAVAAFHASFDAVVREMLSVGGPNWGRVATIFALASWVAKWWCRDNVQQLDACGGRSESTIALLGQLKSVFGRIITERLTYWIVANGGWVCIDIECFFFRTDFYFNVKCFGVYETEDCTRRM
jgi:hypothetical protein